MNDFFKIILITFILFHLKAPLAMSGATAPQQHIRKEQPKADEENCYSKNFKINNKKIYNEIFPENDREKTLKNSVLLNELIRLEKKQHNEPLDEAQRKNYVLEELFNLKEYNKNQIKFLEKIMGKNKLFENCKKEESNNAFKKIDEKIETFNALIHSRQERCDCNQEGRKDTKDNDKKTRPIFTLENDITATGNCVFHSLGIDKKEAKKKILQELKDNQELTKHIHSLIQNDALEKIEGWKKPTELVNLLLKYKKYINDEIPNEELIEYAIQSEKSNETIENLLDKNQAAIKLISKELKKSQIDKLTKEINNINFKRGHLIKYIKSVLFSEKKEIGSKTIEIFKNIFKNNNSSNIFYTEPKTTRYLKFNTLGDGDCGYHSLGISREQVIKKFKEILKNNRNQYEEEKKELISKLNLIAVEYEIVQNKKINSEKSKGEYYLNNIMKEKTEFLHSDLIPFIAKIFKKNVRILINEPNNSKGGVKLDFLNEKQRKDLINICYGNLDSKPIVLLRTAAHFDRVVEENDNEQKEEVKKLEKKWDEIRKKTQEEYTADRETLELIQKIKQQ